MSFGEGELEAGDFDEGEFCRWSWEGYCWGGRKRWREREMMRFCLLLWMDGWRDGWQANNWGKNANGCCKTVAVQYELTVHSKLGCKVANNLNLTKQFFGSLDCWIVGSLDLLSLLRYRPAAQNHGCQAPTGSFMSILSVHSHLGELHRSLSPK